MRIQGYLIILFIIHPVYGSTYMTKSDKKGLILIKLNFGQDNTEIMQKYLLKA